MIKTLFIFILMPTLALAQSQWDENGDNTTSGRILLYGPTSSTDYDDISITRSKASAGIKLFNENQSGRAVILFGQGLGGKYGFVAHHGQTYSAETPYTQTYLPASTVLVGSDVNGLGIISKSDIRVTAGGLDDSKQRMVIKSNGNVGINTALPSALLNVQQSSGSWNAGIRLSFMSKNWDIVSDSNGDRLIIANGNIAKGLVIHNGNVGIGSGSPNNKLTVNGTIYGKEVKVDLSVPAPDYVFDKDYDLLSLEELKAYVETHGHLPDVPSAKEMEENGINLSEMNMILLKKVEELTLYVIGLKEENAKIRKQSGLK